MKEVEFNSSKVLLLLEDDIEQAEICIQIFGMKGVTVFWASALQQAQKILAVHSKVIGAVLSDNHLSGQEVGLQMKELSLFYQIPCFVASGWPSPGVDLPKPLDWKKMDRVIDVLGK